MEKLYRNRESTIGGVCSGLADYFKLDESIMKAIFAILIFTPVPITFIYIILWIIIPKEDPII